MKKQARIVGQPKRDMAAGEIVLALRHQHFAGDDQFLLDGLVRCLFTGRLEHVPHLLRIEGATKQGMGRGSRGSVKKRSGAAG